MSVGLGNASGSRSLELGLAHGMLGLEFGVASSVKKYSGKAFASEVLVRALWAKESIVLSSAAFASAE